MDAAEDVHGSLATSSWRLCTRWGWPGNWKGAACTWSRRCAPWGLCVFACNAFGADQADGRWGSLGETAPEFGILSAPHSLAADPPAPFVSPTPAAAARLKTGNRGAMYEVYKSESRLPPLQRLPRIFALASPPPPQHHRPLCKMAALPTLPRSHAPHAPHAPTLPPLLTPQRPAGHS